MPIRSSICKRSIALETSVSIRQTGRSYGQAKTAAKPIPENGTRRPLDGDERSGGQQGSASAAAQGDQCRQKHAGEARRRGAELQIGSFRHWWAMQASRSWQVKEAGRPAGRKAVARRAKPRSKGPAKADKFLAKLPAKFTLDDLRKVAGKAAPISLAQGARSKKIKKTASGYQKAA